MVIKIGTILKSLNVHGDITPEFVEKRLERKKIEEQKMVDELFREEKRRMLAGSLISDSNDLKVHFEDFQTDSMEQLRVLKAGRDIANRIYLGSKDNFVFTGNVGSGKTMLAVAVLNGINESCPRKTCLFVSSAMLINLEREALISSSDFIKNKVYRLEKRIQKCDLLVLDDLGSETSLHEDITESSEFIQRTMFRIADYRKNKANIVTTNNNSDEVCEMYNQKIVSRLLTKNLKNVVIFSGEDMRNR